MRPWVALLAAAGLLLVQPVHAGTAAAPEITDPPGDAILCVQSPACAPSQDSVDITAGWIDETADGKVTFHLAVKAAPPASGAGAGSNVPDPVGFCAQLATYFEYDFNFQATDPAGNPLVAADAGGNKLTALFLRAVLHCDTPSGTSAPTGFEFDVAYTYDTTSGSHIVVVPVDGALTGNVFSWTLDRSDPLLQVPLGAAAAGYKIDGLSAVSGVAGSLVALSLNTIVADTAPDSGTGIPYTFGGAAPAAIYQNVTTPTFSLVAKNPAATNATYVYNWTASGSNLGLTYALASTQGSARVVVRDAANATVFNQTLSAHQNATVALSGAQPGPWQVTVKYSNFTGDLSLGIAPQEASSSSSSSSTSTTAATTTSSSESSSASSSTGFALQHTKKSPGVGVLAAGVLALAAVAVRRRLP